MFPVYPEDWFEDLALSGKPHRYSSMINEADRKHRPMRAMLEIFVEYHV